MINSRVNFLVKIPIRCWDINKTRHGITFICRTLYMCQKLWKLAGSRQSYSKNNQPYVFGPPCTIIYLYCKIYNTAYFVDKDLNSAFVCIMTFATSLLNWYEKSMQITNIKDIPHLQDRRDIYTLSTEAQLVHGVLDTLDVKLSSLSVQHVYPDTLIQGGTKSNPCTSVLSQANFIGFKILSQSSSAINFQESRRLKIISYL